MKTPTLVKTIVAIVNATNDFDSPILLTIVSAIFAAAPDCISALLKPLL